MAFITKIPLTSPKLDYEYSVEEYNKISANE